MPAAPDASPESPARSHSSIGQTEQLKLSQNVLLGNFTGLTTVQVQAMKLVDPTAGPTGAGHQAVVPLNAWRPGAAAQARPAAPPRGLLGRAWNAIGAAAKGLLRAVSQPFASGTAPDLDSNPALRLKTIQSDTGLWTRFTAACKERYCTDELKAFCAAEDFLANPDKATFLAMTKSAKAVNLPDDQLVRLGRQEASAKEALPFNRPVAIRLAEDVRDNLKNLLQDNILQDRTLLAKHGLNNTVLLAQRKKAALSAG